MEPERNGPEREIAGLDCHRCRTLLVPYLDGEVEDPVEGRLKRHVRNCAACAERLDEHRRIGAAIAGWGAGAARHADDFVRAVRHRLRRNRARRRRRMAAAAAFLIVATVGLILGVPRPAGEVESLILRDLDVLETIQEEMRGEIDGLNPEMFGVLLEEAASQDVLDLRVFEYVLEEEIESNNL